MSDFPKADNKYIKSSDFQDNETTLTFLSWEKKGNVDREGKNGKPGTTWKQNLKYQLRYSYPKFAVDEAGEKILGTDDKPFVNKNYDENYPNGYSIIYKFEEGQLDAGSLPLFNAFCKAQPKKGDTIKILRTGVDKETKWKVSKVGEKKNQDFSTTDIDANDLSDSTPF
jgi:hypothetical protein